MKVVSTYNVFLVFYTSLVQWRQTFLRALRIPAHTCDCTTPSRNTSCGNGGEGSKIAGDVSKLKAREVNVAQKSNSNLSEKVSNDGKHGDTSVLDLDLTKAVKLDLVTVGDKAEGIVESKRRLGRSVVVVGNSTHVSSRAGEEGEQNSNV